MSTQFCDIPWTVWRQCLSSQGARSDLLAAVNREQGQTLLNQMDREDELYAKFPPNFFAVSVRSAVRRFAS